MTRRVLITGANKGIGQATVAAALERDPECFVFLGSRSKERGEAAKAELSAERSGWAERIEVLGLDVADDASVAAAAEHVAQRYGRTPAPLSGIVNNAGIGLGSADLATILDVNTRGPKRVIDAFLPLLVEDGRIVNVSSASGPMFVSGCSEARQAEFTNPGATWQTVEALMKEALDVRAAGGDFAGAGLGEGNAYGLSKALLNLYTMSLAREYPRRTINACTPGYIATDLTLPHAKARGMDPAAMGMKTPKEGSRASIHLLFGEPGGSGWYFGSDAQRSPLDRYRSPGDPAYTGA
ncbi:MAG: SDR family NAD(P)-dependent oxidoreductase [Polyangiaceae bacterium]|nr:SDR family NAD(P)-dependent oxidoreductase [Myxococcales bacterium]MCB9587763.1 SDR family NAD(P)-dependent oxidoreductase [Polyangiaceae bacterium]